MVSPLDDFRRAGALSVTLRRRTGPASGGAGRLPLSRSGAAPPTEAAPPPDAVEAVLRTRLATLGSEPGRRGVEGARIVVAALLERQLGAALSADPRFGDWVDGAVAALDQVPAWREEVACLVGRLTAID